MGEPGGGGVGRTDDRPGRPQDAARHRGGEVDEQGRRQAVPQGDRAAPDVVLRRVDAEHVAHRRRVDLGHLVDDVAVGVEPAPFLGVTPRKFGDVETGIEQAPGVGAHLPERRAAPRA